MRLLPRQGLLLLTRTETPPRAALAAAHLFAARTHRIVGAEAFHR
jgi:hypothetical protein